MNENMENRSELLVKWLRVLMYIAIVSLVNSAMNFLPFVPAEVTTWISRGIMVAVVVCMFQLARRMHGIGKPVLCGLSCLHVH